ncbi:hypothetical protein MTR_5g035960 [Medicago truncatula]|uniref:Uncharacterized protein n=1 Tax=Medicago truncatula TaxID=3880 RepID=G7K5I0_MEDTR|nr:hypothetical protein MTR_5g035960 [Medicago truncatula]
MVVQISFLNKIMEEEKEIKSGKKKGKIRQSDGDGTCGIREKENKPIPWGAPVPLSSLHTSRYGPGRRL